MACPSARSFKYVHAMPLPAPGLLMTTIGTPIVRASSQTFCMSRAVRSRLPAGEDGVMKATGRDGFHVCASAQGTANVMTISSNADTHVCNDLRDMGSRMETGKETDTIRFPVIAPNAFSFFEHS